MASEVLISISRDEVERARLTSEYKYVVDHQSKMVQAERRGRAEGEKLVKQKGAMNYLIFWRAENQQKKF
ncbi:MAG: hypothetical protein Ta2G_18790 [Termitinemataceae bacterium]|nr:MAG: hypothetical protein Ta2G_18790 [Termitinemataceae bacterium]